MRMQYLKINSLFCEKENDEMKNIVITGGPDSSAATWYDYS